jgi:hypothetical protein
VSERKLDIFTALAASDRKQGQFYAMLSDEEKKGFVPTVHMRWLSGTGNSTQVTMVNEYLNPYVFSLYRHPEMLWKLTTVCTTGRQQRYQWVKAPSKTTTGKTNVIKLIMEYFKYSATHATEALPLLGKDALLAIADELGWQPDDITKLKRELK